jgi:hypothetical protein
MSFRLLHWVWPTGHIIRIRILNWTKKQIADIPVEFTLEGTADQKNQQHSPIRRWQDHKCKESNKVNQVHALNTINLAKVEPHVLYSPKPDPHRKQPVHLVVDRAIIEISLHSRPQHYAIKLPSATTGDLNKVSNMWDKSYWYKSCKVQICANCFEITVWFPLPWQKPILGNQVACSDP